jgi:hypothetical protein
MSEEETNQSAPTEIENPISEPNPAPASPQEPTEQASIPPTESIPSLIPSDPTETSPSPEDATLVKDDISANEPLNQPVETAQTVQEPQQTEANPEQNPVPETLNNPPDKAPEQQTAQMAGNEPIDLAEEIKIKKREENLKLANQTRLEKKREKIDKILDLFAKQTNLTNDEVEKLLHVSDATATRYLETLEKEGKIKQVGKTGKGVKYEKI